MDAAVFRDMINKTPGLKVAITALFGRSTPALRPTGVPLGESSVEREVAEWRKRATDALLDTILDRMGAQPQPARRKRTPPEFIEHDLDRGRKNLLEARARGWKLCDESILPADYDGPRDNPLSGVEQTLERIRELAPRPLRLPPRVRQLHQLLPQRFAVLPPATGIARSSRNLTAQP